MSVRVGQKNLSQGSPIQHYEACRIMTSDDPEGKIFLSHSHTNDGFLSLLTINFYTKLQEVPDYPEI